MVLEEEVSSSFMIKCPNPQLLETSKATGVWGINEQVKDALVEATKKLSASGKANQGGKVALVFSVNMSGHFQGYALVTGNAPVQQKLDIWGAGGQDFQYVLQVQWAFDRDLPFGETKHLKNATNSGKSVHVTKHGQEIELKVGRELCDLLRKKAENRKCGPPTKPIKLSAAEASPEKRKSPSLHSDAAKKVQKTAVDSAPLSLLKMSYEEYASLFEKFKVFSQKLDQLGGGTHFQLIQTLDDLSEAEKDEIVRYLSMDDFMDVCRIVCNMNDVEFSLGRERAFVDFYNRASK